MSLPCMGLVLGYVYSNKLGNFFSCRIFTSLEMDNPHQIVVDICNYTYHNRL